MADEPELNQTEYDTLVLSGGSVMAISTLGALQYLKDNSLISNIKYFVGTSAGAIISYLLIIGYTPIEMVVYLCTNHHVFEKLKCFDIVKASRGDGATTFLHIADQIEKMTIEKTGRLFTMKDLHFTFQKRLVCITYNVSKNCVEWLDHEHTPDLPCITALRMSSNLPLVFEPFKYGDSFYIDGGLSNNFPVDIGEKLGNKVLGINVGHLIGEDNPNINLIEYIYKLILIPLTQLVISRIDNVRVSTKVINIKRGTPLKFFEFNINSKSKLDLFSKGYEECKETFFEVNHKVGSD